MTFYFCVLYVEPVGHKIPQFGSNDFLPGGILESVQLSYPEGLSNFYALQKKHKAEYDRENYRYKLVLMLYEYKSNGNINVVLGHQY